jgi:hypothetical protein
VTRQITASTTLDNLRHEAKRWLKALRANDSEAHARLRRAYPNAPSPPTLRDMQRALALEFDLPGWTALKQRLAISQYELLANDMVAAYATGDAEAMQRINRHYEQSATVEDLRATVWRLMEKVRRAKGAAHAFGIAEAQELIARTSGFNNWIALTNAVAKGAPPPGQPYTIDSPDNKITPRRNLTGKDWDTIIAVMKERQISALDAIRPHDR